MRSIISLLMIAAIFLCLIAAQPQPLNAQLLDHNACIAEISQQRKRIKAMKERITVLYAEDTLLERLKTDMGDAAFEWKLMRAEKNKKYDFNLIFHDWEELEAFRKIRAEVEKEWEEWKSVRQNQQVVVEGAEL